MADIAKQPMILEPLFVHLPAEFGEKRRLNDESNILAPCGHWQPGALLRATCRGPPQPLIPCPPGLGPQSLPVPIMVDAGSDQKSTEAREQRVRETTEQKGRTKSEPKDDTCDAACDTQLSGRMVECADDAAVEEALKPVLRDILNRENPRKSQQGGFNSSIRWWTRPNMPVLCPLTRFPICLLPYPPFKLRMDPKRPSPHRLVDGKFLAMNLVVSGAFSACGRQLQASDLSALDDYVHRCKLGPYRPGRAAALREQAQTAGTEEERTKASKDLERFIAMTKVEMGKLRRIQENRMTLINKSLPAHIQVLLKGPKLNLDEIPATLTKSCAAGAREHSSSFASASTCYSSSASDVSQD